MLPEAGRFDEAVTTCQEAAAIFQEFGNRHREGIALHNLKKADAGHPEQRRFLSLTVFDERHSNLGYNRRGVHGRRMRRLPRPHFTA
jgi:hypothetical protein